MTIDRRGFLALGAAGLARAQSQPGGMPEPAKAKITSCVMLWTLSGTFEERVKTAALAGMQTVGLRDEYVQWDDTAFQKAKRHIESFGMTAETTAAGARGGLDSIKAAVRAAERLDAPYVIAGGKEIPGDLAASAKVTFLVDDLNLVKDMDNPRVRLLFNVCEKHSRQAKVAVSLRDALEYTAMVQIADSPGRHQPGTGRIDFREIYRILAKGGYNHCVAMEYLPEGDPVASLKKAVDQFRAGVNERGGPVAAEAALV